MLVNSPRSAAPTFSAALDLPQGAVHAGGGVRVLQRQQPPTGLGVGLTRTSARVPERSAGASWPSADSCAARKHTIVITSLQPSATSTTWPSCTGCRPSSSGRARFGFFGARVAWSNGLLLTQLSPQARKLDTRNPGPLTGKIITGQTKTLALTPELIVGAKSALVNLTITNTEGSGFLGLFPSGTSWPGTSSINWSGPNQIVANSVTVAVSPEGSIDISCGGGGRTHVVVDLLGYYRLNLRRLLSPLQQELLFA